MGDFFNLSGILIIFELYIFIVIFSLSPIYTFKVLALYTNTRLTERESNKGYRFDQIVYTITVSGDLITLNYRDSINHIALNVGVVRSLFQSSTVVYTLHLL